MHRPRGSCLAVLAFTLTKGWKFSTICQGLLSNSPLALRLMALCILQAIFGGVLLLSAQHFTQHCQYLLGLQPSIAILASYLTQHCQYLLADVASWSSHVLVVATSGRCPLVKPFIMLWHVIVEHRRCILPMHCTAEMLCCNGLRIIFGLETAC